MRPHRPWRSILALAAAGLALSAPGAAGQAAVDPSVAPRAAALERRGDRPGAVEMLGRYLATAPDDGRAWFELGRFYLMDTRDWHLSGHHGEPSGSLYLDFAATALDQAVRLGIDSGAVPRAVVEMSRMVGLIEDDGWTRDRSLLTPVQPPELPAFVLELGTNLLNSCPMNGVLATGSDLEAVAVWYGLFIAGRRSDLIPLLPELYRSDARYRQRMAEALGVQGGLTMTQALGKVRSRRAVCLSPLVDSSDAPEGQWTASRLVRVSGPAGAGEPLPDGLSITSLLSVERQGGLPWSHAVASVYWLAARRNQLLCAGILTQLGDRPQGACGQ